MPFIREARLERRAQDAWWSPQRYDRRSCGNPCRYRVAEMATLMAALVLRETGAPIAFSPEPDMDGWSTLVWDLLRVTAFQAAPLRQTSQPRGTPRGAVSLYLHELLLTSARHPVDVAIPQYKAIEGPGFGVVHLEFGARTGPVQIDDNGTEWGA
jgi:hypothetical protein